MTKDELLERANNLFCQLATSREMALYIDRDSPYGKRVDEWVSDYGAVQKERITIGHYSSYTLASCDKGHAVSVPADGLLDKMLKEGMTLEESGAAANLLARDLCETCKEDGEADECV